MMQCVSKVGVGGWGGGSDSISVNSVHMYYLYAKTDFTV